MTTPTLSVGPFQINTFDTGDQDDAVIIANPAGFAPGFQIFYESDGFSSSGDDILSAFFDLGTGALTETDQPLLTSGTIGFQNNHSATQLADGTTTVVAFQDQQGNDAATIQYLISAGGTDTVFPVTTTLSLADFNPRVDALPDGGFVIAWEAVTGLDTLDYGTDGNGDPVTFDEFAILYQLFDADGTARGTAGQVDTGVFNALEYGPDIAVAEDGTIGVGYTIEELEVDGSGFFRDAGVAQISSDGTLIDGLSYVSDGGLASSWATVTALRGGVTLLTWREIGNTTQIFGRLVDQDLNTSDSFQITAGGNDQFDITIAPLTDGGFAATWFVGIDADTGERDVLMQRFDSDGAVVGDLIVLAGGEGEDADQYNPNIAFDGDRTLLATWEDRGSAGDSIRDDETFGATYTLDDYLLGISSGASDFFAGLSIAELTALGAGNDTFRGLDGDDTIFGNGGSDDLNGDLGDDSMVGGIGFDTIHGGTGDDTLIGGDGFDSLIGSTGLDILSGNNGNDVLIGGMGNDTLTGGLGFDSMSGSEGDDVVSGQSGSDLVLGGSGGDLLNGNAGADSLAGQDGNDTLNGGINNDLLIGGAGDDLLNGNNGTDTLQGGLGDDRLEGNAGTDSLDGQGGDDVLRGGIGIDTFVFEVGYGHDRVADFQNNIDVIEIAANLLTEETPVAEDLRGYTTLDASGNLVLVFDANTSLTLTGVTNTTAILDDVVFV